MATFRHHTRIQSSKKKTRVNVYLLRHYLTIEASPNAFTDQNCKTWLALIAVRLKKCLFSFPVSEVRMIKEKEVRNGC